MKIKTQNLTGAALDCAVHIALHGACEGYAEHEYSTDWAHGGLIIERENISTDKDHDCWNASIDGPAYYSGPTPLIAAMRCYVASKLGYEVEIPEGLI
jgi:hypothetical protein